ncbi:MAG: hypothetical protein HDT16_03515 [Oscillibacter sp.]|nr:hypothetical protein [Oscillibacter sp.]
MPYYHTCPDCGAHLDHGEHCDCREEKRARAARLIAPLTAGEKLQLLEMLKKIPASAANTDGDGTEKIETYISTSTIAETSGLVNS